MNRKLTHISECVMSADIYMFSTLLAYCFDLDMSNIHGTQRSRIVTLARRAFGPSRHEHEKDWWHSNMLLCCFEKRQHGLQNNCGPMLSMLYLACWQTKQTDPEQRELKWLVVNCGGPKVQ